MKEESMIKQIVTSVVVGIFGASIGFGTSQLTVGGEVKTHTVEIRELKETDKRLDATLASHHLTFNKLLETNQDLINLIRVQNELLNRKIQP